MNKTFSLHFSFRRAKAKAAKKAAKESKKRSSDKTEASPEDQQQKQQSTSKKSKHSKDNADHSAKNGENFQLKKASKVGVSNSDFFMGHAFFRNVPSWALIASITIVQGPQFYLNVTENSLFWDIRLLLRRGERPKGMVAYGPHAARAMPV